MVCFRMIKYARKTTCNSVTLPHKQPPRDHCPASKSSTPHQILTGRCVTPVPSWPSLLLFTLTFIGRADVEATKRWSSFRPFTPPLLFFFTPVAVRAILKKNKKKTRVSMAVRHLSKEQRKSSLQKKDLLKHDDNPPWKGWWCKAQVALSDKCWNGIMAGRNTRFQGPDTKPAPPLLCSGSL